MNTFYIVRHGETDNNRDKRLSGWIDTPLTENGLKPTDTVIDKLKDIRIDAIHSSDLGRAFVTAYYITRGLGFTDEIVRQPGLREVNYGDAANMLRTEAYKLWPGLDQETEFTPPRGESLSDMQRRVFQTVIALDKKHKDSNILLVCHSGVIAALRSWHIGDDFGKHNMTEAYEHDYVGVFTMDGDKVASFEAL